MGKEKNGKNDLPLPPDGGEWRFCMVSGMVIPGTVMAVYDNVVIVETPLKETVVLHTKNIESLWEGKGIQEEQKKGEDKA